MSIMREFCELIKFEVHKYLFSLNIMTYDALTD